MTHSLVTIFSVIFLGFFCGKKDFFNNEQIEGFETFLFKIAIPCYLFSSTLNHSFHDLVNFNYVFSYLLAFSAIGLITALFLWKNGSLSSTVIKILVAGYVNTAFYSVPVLTFLLDDPKAAILSNIIQVVLINSMFVMILSFINHREKSIAHKIVASISNPLTVMPIAGILLNYYEIKPLFIITTLTDNIGLGASSMALFTFGLGLSNTKINTKSMTKELSFIVFLKNVLHPVIAFVLGKYVFHLENYWLTSLVIVTAAPTAFIVYFIAKQFKIDQELAKITVAVSSVLSLLSLIVIAWLK